MHSRDDEDDSEEEEQAPPSITALLGALAGGGGADDSDSDEPEALPLADPPAAEEASAAPSTASSSLLPSADDALDASLEHSRFLEVQGPEFDASKRFKPPPTVPADFLASAAADSRRGVPPAYADDPEQPRYTGLTTDRQDSVRLRGSVCHETDDERGRRVVYGAHQMLKADPWSDCNPNFAMQRGNKRRR